MRLYPRLILVIFLAVAMLTASFVPAAAGAQKIQVTGTCTGLKFFVGDEADAKYRFWMKPDGSKMHWRNQLILFYCDFSDDRLDGHLMASDNWNTDSNPNNGFNARTFGEGYSADQYGNKLDLWEGSYTAYYDTENNYTMKMTYIGKGEYQTLRAKLLLTFPSGGFPFVDVAGELLVPGK